MMNKAVSIALKLMIWVYKTTLSPLIPAACRHYPTCSRYALEAIDRHGPWHGWALAMNRLGRCRPGGTFGPDPVPLIIVKKMKTNRRVRKQSCLINDKAE